MLWVAPQWRERLAPIGATYMNLADPAAGLESPPHPEARRYDAPAIATETSAAALAAHDVLAGHGWDAVHARAADLAAQLADSLTASGHVVAARGRTTLVAWEDPDPASTRARLAEAGVIVRDLPGTPYLRASVGAWNDEGDLQRLLAAL
jgi:L-cysteine/cystine lyase